jgi:hypothetical protein
VKAVDAAGNTSTTSSSVSARLVAQGTGTTGTLSGVVVNASGATLRNASVTVTSAGGSPKSAKTGNNGVWEVRSLSAGTYTVTISLSGYPTQSATMTLTGGQTVIGITTLS